MQVTPLPPGTPLRPHALQLHVFTPYTPPMAGVNTSHLPTPYTQPKPCALQLQHFPLCPHPGCYTHIPTYSGPPQPPQHCHQGRDPDPEISQNNTAAASHPLMYTSHPARGLAAPSPLPDSEHYSPSSRANSPISPSCTHAPYYPAHSGQRKEGSSPISPHPRPTAPQPTSSSH